MKQLTAFQRDLLYVIASINEPYGRGIKRRIEEYHEKDISAGQVYQNLDKLAEDGYIEKSEIDGRKKSYTLTSKAFDSIENRHTWQTERVGQGLGWIRVVNPLAQNLKSLYIGGRIP